MSQHDLGLSADLMRILDLRRMLDRRRALRLFGAGALVTLAACSGDSGTETASSSSTAPPDAGNTEATTDTNGPSTSSPGAGACEETPGETAGPYPGDGTNGPNVLAESGVVREDITASFGSSSTKAAGLPFTIRFDVVDGARGCAPYAGAAVYAWHCDAGGGYSLYSRGITHENYLRGVQAAGRDGAVTFRSIFPGAYAGRWPHIHFEVFPTLDAAGQARNRIATSQIALPPDACDAAYSTAGYETSARNMRGLSLARDNVFADDGGVRQLGAVTGDVNRDMTVTLTVVV